MSNCRICGAGGSDPHGIERLATPEETANQMIAECQGPAVVCIGGFDEGRRGAASSDVGVDLLAILSAEEVMRWRRSSRSSTTGRGKGMSAKTCPTCGSDDPKVQLSPCKFRQNSDADAFHRTEGR